MKMLFAEYKEVVPLRIRDKVLLYRNLLETTWSSKLEPKWEGPYLIRSIKGTTYQLKKLNGSLVPFKVHRNRLKKYVERRSDYISFE